MHTSEAGVGELSLIDAVDLHVPGIELQPVTLALGAGDRIGLLGAQGSGKGALLRALARLERPAGGHLFWNGVDVTRRPRWLMPGWLKTQVMLIWANPYFLFEDRFRVRAVVRGAQGDGRPSAAALLKKARLSSATLEHKIASLSGLQRARVALAYAQWRKPRVILVDDLFGHLVPESWDGFMADLGQIAGQTRAVLVASRFPEALRSMSRTYALRNGEIFKR